MPHSIQIKQEQKQVIVNSLQTNYFSVYYFLQILHSLINWFANV